MRDTGKKQGDSEWRPRRDIGRFGRERRNQAEIYEDPGKKRPERGGGRERYKEIRNIKLLQFQNFNYISTKISKQNCSFSNDYFLKCLQNNKQKMQTNLVNNDRV
jgi:hypothetical protein